jgi:hypothetical protein
MSKALKINLLLGWLGGILRFSLPCFALFAAGCSTFNNDWKRMAAEPISASGIQGRWEGTWRSDVNGHNGRLRCIISAQGEGKYQARFYATYRRILHFGYPVTLDAQKTNDVFKFKGEADLGWLAGGRYEYEGQITPTNFFSIYRSKHDHGVFQMTRP